MALLSLVSGIIAFSGCKSPEERAMDEFDRAMRKQTYMMKRMEKTMDRMDRELQQAD
jgi:hypothetical protein